MYKNNRWLLLLPCISLLLLVSFNKMIRKKLWQADPYLRRKARVEQACRDFKEQIERDEEKRARTEHPPDIHFKSRATGVKPIFSSTNCTCTACRAHMSFTLMMANHWLNHEKNLNRNVPLTHFDFDDMRTFLISFL